MSFFSMKMSNATMKRHNNNATLNAITEFFKSETFDTRGEEIAVVRGTAEAYLCVTVSGNGTAFVGWSSKNE
jgi:hypothetical protein